MGVHLHSNPDGGNIFRAPCRLINFYLVEYLPEYEGDDVRRLPEARVEQVGQRVGREVGQAL